MVRWNMLFFSVSTTAVHTDTHPCASQELNLTAGIDDNQVMPEKSSGALALGFALKSFDLDSLVTRSVM